MIIYQPQHPLSSFRFDPITLLTVALVGAAGFGVAEAAGGFGSSPKAPSTPALPNPQTAQTSAQDTVNQQRRLALLTGGMTDYTGGNAQITSNDVNKTLLLGG